MTGLRKITSRVTTAAKRLYHCEQGAEGLEKLLIIGAIVLPLLAALIWFKDDISNWVSDGWDDARDADDAYDPNNALSSP